MTIAEREQQIIRVKSQSFQSEMVSELENTLRSEVTGVIKATIEAALVEELESFRSSRTVPPARRSGYFREAALSMVESLSYEFLNCAQTITLGNGRFSNVIKEDFKACWI